MSKPRTWIEIDQQGVGWEVTFSPSDHSTVYGSDVTTKRQLPPEITNYCCRFCGHDSFEAIHRNPEVESHRNRDIGSGTIIGPGPYGGMPTTHTWVITDYRCPNCTVHFDDPAKFSKHQPAKVVAPVATSADDVWRIRYGLPPDFEPAKLNDELRNRQ